MGYVYLICIFLLSLLVLQVGRWSVTLRRSEWSEAKLLDSFSVGELNACKEALKRLSQMYAIRIGYLRPTDEFHKQGFLWKWDSWHLWGGQERLEEFLRQHGIEVIPDAWTVLDYVVWFGQMYKDAGVPNYR